MSLALCLLLAGCGTLQAYSGSAQPADGLALLRPELSLGSHVVLEEVNGISVRFWQDRAVVAPGPLQVRATAVLTHSYRTLTRRHELEFDAVSGEEYTLSADWHLYGARVQVFDQHGELVAEAVEPPPPLRVMRSEPVGARQ